MAVRKSGKHDLSAPARLMRGPLPNVAIGLFGLAGIALLVVVRPTLGSPLWWLCLATGVGGALLALWDWRHLGKERPYPLSLITDLLAVLHLWQNPESIVGPLLLVLVSTFISAFFGTPALRVHLLLAAAGVVGYLWVGAGTGPAIFLAVTLLTVTAFMRVLFHALQEQAVQTDHLQRLMELLPVLKAHGLEEVIRAAVRHMVKATVSDVGVVLLFAPTTQNLRARYIFGESPLSPEEERAMMSVDVPMGMGLTGWVAQHGQPLLTGDAARDPRALLVPGTRMVDESIMVVPLMTSGRFYGVIRLDRKGLNQYRQDDLNLLELLAAHVSDALSRAELEERMARRDALTGVYNRHFLNEWSERVEPDRSEISILMIDCRDFKKINDRWGHLEGDRILREAAGLISDSVRTRDLVVRYGGDEFLVVLEDTGPSESQLIADRLTARVREWNETQPADAPVLSLDIGIESAPRSQWQNLLGRADLRMYASKRGA